MTTVRILRAFVRRDALDATSYKLVLVKELASLLASILSVYFLARMIGTGSVAALRPYGGDYFAFALVGTALADYVATSLNGMSRGLRLAQTLGTLEAMLATPAPRWTIAFGSAAYRLIWSLVRVGVYLIAGLVLGASFEHADPVAALLALALSLLAFLAVGRLAAASVLILTAFEPVTALFTGLSWLLGGVLYPTASLPAPLEAVAAFLPITHALEALRRSLLQGASISDIGRSLLALVAFSVVILPLAAWAYRRAIHRIRVDGSVSHY